MQTDMHFYGTYAMARAAGIPDEDAFIIAYSAQYVDDSSQQDSKEHEDRGLLYGIATAHHPIQAGINAQSLHAGEIQRRVWVPFHFMPGGFGDTFEEQLICQKDSDIANEFFKNHIEIALKDKPFGLHLLGIASHVYADTFSHYGFSGISSKYNEVKSETLEVINAQDPEKYTKEKKDTWYQKYVSDVLEFSSRALGHGGVLTYPDKPFLHWRVEFEETHPEDTTADRDNPATFLEACKKLHNHLSNFARRNYDSPRIINFSTIEEAVDGVLRLDGDKDKRISNWKKRIISSAPFEPTDFDINVKYDHSKWDDQKNDFHNFDKSSAALTSDVYRFHQAATYHRYYILKDLLPSHKIAVY